MNYSPIASIRIKNFRNIGDINIDFKESPIIALLGDNEAGKTSVIKSIGVVGLNAYTMDQKRYIRDGTAGFGIQVVLEDGTVITRIKKANENSYKIVYPDKNVWSTDKIDKGCIPVKVAEVMGMIEEQETKEFLHIRTYEEQLLFVLTKASANYKVMYDALKVANITYAIKKGSQEVNSLKSGIRSNEASIVTLNTQLRNTTIYDIEPVLNVRDRLKSYIANYDKLARAKRLADNNKRRYQELRVIEMVSGLPYANDIEAEKINKVLERKKIVDSLEQAKSRYDGLDTVEEIDIAVMGKLNKAEQIKKIVDKSVKELRSSDEISSLCSIDINELYKLKRCIELKAVCTGLYSKFVDTTGLKEIYKADLETINKLNLAMEIKGKIEGLKDTVSKIKDKVDETSNILKETGVKVATCPNCGETVIME